MPARVRFLGFVLLVAQPACSKGVDVHPEPLRYARVVGFIDGGGMPTGPLQGPDTVRAGSPFAITVSTYGSSCIHPGDVEVQAGPSAVDVTPYDSVPANGPPCLPDWMSFSRQVTATMAIPGLAVVRAHGRGFTGQRIVEKAITVIR